MPRTYPSRSQFAPEKMTRDELIQGAKQHCSQARYLAALGIRKRGCLGLSRRMKLEGLTLDDLWPERRSADNRFPEESHKLDLLLDAHAYFYGLALADGHLQSNDRNRGKLSIELKATDEAVLHALHSALPWKGHIHYRSRVTNFGQLAVCSLTYHSRGLRGQLIAAGFPVGKKSDICKPPCVVFNELGFWRGFVDGDGSLGFLADGRPFLSLVTSSDAIAAAFTDWIYRATGCRRNSSRNLRDGVFNIMVTGGDACRAVGALYPQECVSITRKSKIAAEIQAWAPSAEGAA